MRRNITHGRGVPNLVVSQRVIDKMQAAANQHMEDETGEAMVGLVTPGTLTNGVPTIYVLDTISPDDSAVRQYHTFQQGDERQDELIWWLQENWRMMREKRVGLFGKAVSPKWDVPLRYLGDWHKQPGYMIQPSGGDLATALDWIDDPDNNMDFILAPIVTLDHPSTISESSVTTNYLMLPQGDGSSIRIDFWYIDLRTRLFQPVAPAVYPEGQLPSLAGYPWHLADQRRLEDELQLLKGDKLFSSITLWNADGDPPLEVCFLTARMGADKLIILVTPHDYPHRPPTARTAPFVHMGSNDDMYKVFEQAWKASQPITFELAWSPEKTLLEVVHVVEVTLGVRKPGTAAGTLAAGAKPAEKLPETQAEKGDS